MRPGMHRPARAVLQVGHYCDCRVKLLGHDGLRTLPVEKLCQITCLRPRCVSKTKSQKTVAKALPM